MGGTGRNTEGPGDKVPGNGSDERGNEQADGEFRGLGIEGRNVDDIRSNGLGDGRAEEEGSRKMSYGR